jgi:hypothetical protein
MVAPGYWFVAPYSFKNDPAMDIKWDACEIGPAIYDEEGVSGLGFSTHSIHPV